MIQNPLLVKGEIMHRRFSPKINKFKYKSTYISFPISKISKLKRALFSLNKFNFFSLFNKDYGNKTVENIGDWVFKILEENNIKNIKEIVLITHPKILGYVFNPVNFWMCFDEKNQLIAVLSEVNNTCGQKHSYLCFQQNLEAIKGNEWLVAQKEFYVSPFLKIEGKYRFRFDFKDGKMNFYINYLVENKLKLTTSLQCDFVKLSNRNLILSFLKIPFATFKTIILIHYQALKLWLKSIKYYKCPTALDNNLTVTSHEK